MLCRATQDGRVIVESSDKRWSTGGGNGKPSQYNFCENPMNCIKSKKDMIPKDEPSGEDCVQYATGEEWRMTTNSPRKNEVAEPKWKCHSVVDLWGDESKIWCCKEQYCRGTWNVRSMNQGKLDVVKQEMARVKNQHLRNEWTLLIYIIFKKLINFNWRLITLQYHSDFCHTLTWISHRCTCVPHPESPFHLPPHPIPQGHPSAPVLSTLSHASNLDWQFVSHMIIYTFQCYSLKSSHPRLLLQSPKFCPLHLCLFCCLTDRVIITIFLNSIYMR